MSEIFDISPIMSSRLAVFPGDTPFHLDFLMRTDSGDHLTLSKIETTAHVGAHADAPIHYSIDGESIERRSLDYYLGQAQVIRIRKSPGHRILVSDLADVSIQASRILFQTQSIRNLEVWQNDFISLSGELIDFLARQGVRLVGIDTPSIDPAEDKYLESHQAVYRNDMAVLEGLVLSHVPDGIYELIALPLKIEGGDASPVRAILRR